MPTPICTQCGEEIPSEDVNVGQDVAYCRRCNLSHALSELTHEPDPPEAVDLSHPPPGAWYRNDGGGMVAGATHRSWARAAGSLAIGLFWNGIVSVFVLLALAATLKNLHVPVPEWFPAPRMNGEEMGTGMTIFLWLFLTPFILIGLAMIFTFISSLAGHTEAHVFNSQGSVFTGVGPFGWTRRFDASQVKAVAEEESTSHSRNGGGRTTTLVVITTTSGKRIKFGSMMTDERREFVLSAVRQALQPEARSRRR